MPLGARAPSPIESKHMNDLIVPEDTLPSDEQLRAETRSALFQFLAAAGMRRATVSYCGSGDSGGAEGVAFERPDGTQLDPMPSLSLRQLTANYVDGQWRQHLIHAECRLDDALTDLAMALVDDLHGGWEDGDGASGEVVFDVQDAKVLIQHNAYFTDSESTVTIL